MQCHFLWKRLIFTCLIFHHPIIYSASDPVSWSLSPASGFPATSVGNQSSVTYTLTSHLPQTTAMLTSYQITGPGIVIEDGCNQVQLAPGRTCQITLIYRPTTNGKTRVRLTYGYNNNRIPVPELVATATGLQPEYNLSGIIPNFPASITPTGTYNFSAVFTNTGHDTLTDCFAGNLDGSNQFTLSPSSRATVSTTDNPCGTADHPIKLSTTSPGNSCIISGTLSGPYQTGSFTLSSIMHCAQAASNPTVASSIVTPVISLNGAFTQPDPFPTTFYDNEAPYVTAKFTNTGNTELTNCFATGTGFTLNPSNVGEVVTTTQQSSCGSSGNKVSLQPNQSCYLYGQMTNLTPSTNPVGLTAAVTCSEASAAPEKTFAITHNSGSCTSLNIEPVLPLPASTYVYADNVVKFKVTNECLENSIVLGKVNLSATSGSASISTNGTYDKCSYNTIPAGGHCDLTASVIPSSTTNLVIQAAVTPTSPVGGSEVSTTTTATVSSNQQSTHHFYFVNQCDFDVWYGIGNAAGTSGDATADPNLSTYPAGAPASAYYLPAQVPGEAPSTIDLSFSSYINGALWPRTGCTMSEGQFVCATGTCATLPNSATCVSGTATLSMPLPPYTKIEQTIEPTAGADGVYDVSIINGMNVPVEMKAFGPLGANQVGSTPGNPNDVYTCSGAGAVIQSTYSSLLAGCPWEFDPSSTLTGISNVNSDFYWVTPGADDGCTSSSLPNLCGMAYDVSPPANPNKINRKTGDFLGFSTLTNYIGYTKTSQWGSQNLYNIYGMATPITSTSTVQYGPPNNYTVMIGCIYDKSLGSANSCNLGNLTNAEYQACCGCVNWSMTTPNTPCGDNSANWPGTGTNSLWTSNTPSQATVDYTIQKAVTWLKNACPTTYVYQFDDTASSFQCNTDGQTQLYTSYQITFCPGGLSGLPKGATEGRGTPPA